MAGEGLVVYAHLGPRGTDEVATLLVREGLWDWVGMVYDEDSSLLMTTSDQAKEVVTSVLEKLNLLPEGETVLQPAA